jgi:hypothetical protein
MRWRRRQSDPAPGRCDGGIIVECCTDAEGYTTCGVTPFGATLPGSGALLASYWPDDEDMPDEPGTLETLLDAVDNVPTPIDILTDGQERLKETLEAAKPMINPVFNFGIDVPPWAIAAGLITTVFLLQKK